LVAALARRVIRVEVDAESIDVSVREADVVVEQASRAACDTRISTTARTILDVLEARASLRAAVLDGRLRVIAELASVESLHEALLSYTHAAVRCPGFPSILARFQRLAARPAEAAQ